jgi:hypothetical protein
MIKGMEQGKYIVLFPDTTATCVTAILAGAVPLSLSPFLTIIIAPIAVRQQCPYNLLSCALK